MTNELYPPTASPNNGILQVLARLPGTAQELEVGTDGHLFEFSRKGTVFQLQVDGADVYAQTGDATLGESDAEHLYYRGLPYVERALPAAAHIFVKAKSGTATVYISELG